MLRLVTYVLLIILAFASKSFAVPTISSVSESNGEITISGSSFGSHPDYSPSVSNTLSAAWNNLEPSGNFNSGGMSLTPDFPENWTTVTDGTNRANSTYYGKKFYGGHPTVPRLGPWLHYTSGAGTLMYTSFWFMLPTGTQSGKIARIYSSDPNMFWSTGGGDLDIRGYSTDPSFGLTVYDSPTQFSYGVWARVETISRAGGGNTDVYINGKYQWGRIAFSSGDSFNGHTNDIGHMIDEGSGSYNFDDVYIDYTLARVEICDSATWNESVTRHCEVQIPKSWASGSITVTANNGAFSENDSAYLYVIDENGSVSAGESITIGSGGSADTTSPTLSSTTIDSSGTEADLVFDEAVVTTGYTSGDFTLTCTTANGGSAMNLSSPTGSGVAWSFSIPSTVYSGDSCNISYNGATDGIEDSSGNDLASITSETVTVVGYTADTTSPTLSSTTIDSSGTEADLVFDEAVVTTGYTSGDFTLTCTTANGGSAMNLSSPTGSGVAWSFSTGAITINSGDSCTLAYNGATNGIEDSSGNDLLTISSMSVTVIGATAPPSVTSASESNGEITITGSFFGTHSDYSSTNSNTLARAWNNFETGSVLRDDWQYSNSGAYSSNWQAVTGGVNRTNSTYYAARNNTVSVLGALEMPTSISPTEWYSSFYFQVSDTCPTTSPRGEFTRVWGDNSEALYLEPSGASNYLLGKFVDIGTSEVGTVDTLGTNVWHRVEMYMNKTSQEVSTYIDGKLQWTRNDWPSATFQAQNHTWDIGVYIEQVTNTCYHRFDDVYFDHTPARVEICETGGAWSTAATKHCEVQIPKTWASDSIKVTANHGTFAVNDSVYLYVIDNNGNVSDPYNITLTDIGGGEPAAGQGVFLSGGFGEIGVGTGSFQ